MVVYTVWFRAKRKDKWEYVGKAPTRRLAVELIGGRGTGHWYVKEGAECPVKPWWGDR